MYKNYDIREITKIIFKSTIMYFIIVLLYMEVLFHFVRQGGANIDLCTKVLFSIFFGGILGIVCSLFNHIVNKIITISFTFVLCVYFVIQLIYSGFFNTYLSVFGSIAVTNQAFDYMDVIAEQIKHEWPAVILLMFPFIYVVVLGFKLLDFKRYKGLVTLIQVITIIIFFFFIQMLLKINDKGTYSTYTVYIENSSVDLTVKKLGIIESLYLDGKASFMRKFNIVDDNSNFVIDNDVLAEEEIQKIEEAVEELESDQIDSTEQTSEQITEQTTTEVIIDTSPNVLDINMEEMIDNSPNESIKKIHEYVNSITPTNKNEYTGMFEGYNLIFITAEGFSGYVIDPKLTPTLYKLSNEGFVFKNYYTPLWYGSTLAGEYANLTGLMPKNGNYLSMNMVGNNKNTMMFTLGNQLNNKGYYSVGYHNNDYTYYDRDKSHPLLGYNWIGTGNGYEPEVDNGGTSLWPQSDLYMVDQTFDQYVDNQPFHTYYLTVSGHVMYNFFGNAMSIKNQDYVKDLDYSETTKAYIACQYELELALTSLIDKLDTKGILDNTLIVLTADHVPYDNKDVLDELAGKELEYNFEWYKNSLIVWYNSMEKKVVVDKYCSSLDILPTISNLMGLEYDSRMMVGKDILSKQPGLVIFNDRSFITDSCSYNANTGEVISFSDQPISESYIENKINYVKNKFTMSEKICENDYYKYIKDALKDEQ